MRFIHQQGSDSMFTPRNVHAESSKTLNFLQKTINHAHCLFCDFACLTAPVRAETKKHTRTQRARCAHTHSHATLRLGSRREEPRGRCISKALKNSLHQVLTKL